MSNETMIVELTPENAIEYGCSCFLNPKNEGHQKKLEILLVQPIYTFIICCKIIPEFVIYLSSGTPNCDYDQ
jgi:hypothetical protein